MKIAEVADAGPPPPPVRWARWPMGRRSRDGSLAPPDYAVKGKTVTDNATHLMWQRWADPHTYTWADAQRYCGALELNGHTDWRVPSRVELFSIVDLTVSHPAINQTAFPHTPSDWFWTSSPDAADPNGSAWYVYFYFGYPKTDAKTNKFSVRCVRDAEAPATDATSPTPAYDVQKSVVADRGTGLVWQRAVPAQSFAFEEAQTYCARLRLDGKTGWRVPTLPELVTLVDERRVGPAIDLEGFPHAPGESFWTATRFGANPNMEAWHVYFDSGNALYGLWKGAHRVRCVR